MSKYSPSQTQEYILMVGEIPNTITFLLSLLSQQGYRVHNSLDGEQALEQLAIKLPDLMILLTSLKMPDCYTICQKLKTVEKINEIPILFLNLEDPNFNSSKVFQVGGADYLNYPFPYEEILARIGHQLGVARLKKKFDKQGEQLQQTIDDLHKLEEYMSQVYEEMKEFSFFDNLTKVSNRRRFEEYLDKEWRRCARDRISLRDGSQVILSLVLCNLDFFKAYNYAYGIEAGDECLKKIAQAIQNVIKRPADLVARYEEDIFAIILPNTNLEGAITVASLIRLEVQELAILHSNSQVGEYVTMSYGVATAIPTSALSSELLAKAAKKALEQAKEEGRDRICSDTV